MPAEGRLLLLEFFPGAFCHFEKAILFPFLKGVARRKGFRTLWLCYGGALKASADPSAERTIRAVLSAADRRDLKARLKSFAPTHVVSSDILLPAARRLFDELSPKPKFLVMFMQKETGISAARPVRSEMRDYGDVLSGDPKSPKFLAKCLWFLDWLGIRDERLGERFFVEAVDPDYRATLANPAAGTAATYITILGGALCSNKNALKDNPLYADIGPEHERHRGCAFCGASLDPGFSPPGADIMAIVERQFMAIRKTWGKGRDKGIYEFFDCQTFGRIDSLVKMLLRLRIPPSVLLFNPRIDDVLAARSRIEAVLPALAKSGHEVRCLTIGIENFSEMENRRLSKNITRGQLDEFFALARRWEQSFPGVFKPFAGDSTRPELGMILYTPWTTLEDLRINLEECVKRGFSPRMFGLYSALHIYPGAPIAALARREKGILVDRHPDRAVLYGAHQNDRDVINILPWRFKDRSVEDFFAVIVRVCAAAMDGGGCAFFKEDPEFHALSGIYADAVERYAATPLDVACRLVDALEGRKRRFPSREALLRSAVARLAEGPWGPPARPDLPAEAKPDPGGRASVPPSPEAPAVRKAFSRLLRERRPDFSGVSFRGAAKSSAPSGRGTRVSLSVNGRDLVFTLVSAVSPVECFHQSKRFKAVLSEDTPSSDPAERRVVEALLAEIDRCPS